MRMNVYGWALTVLALVTSCSVTAPIARRGYNATAVHTPRTIREQPKDNAGNGYFLNRKSDGTKEYFIPAKVIDGERMMCLTLDEVTVVARSRSLPERMGCVNVDFIVTMPKGLQGNGRTVTVTPVLHRNGRRIPLQALIIRGGLFAGVQERDYWQYGRFLDRFAPDSLRAVRAFRRFVRYPYPKNVRLDSIVVHAADISCHYTQSVPTAEAGNRLRITLESYVTGLDGSRIDLPASDTLEYVISSMISFVDTATRYVNRVVERYAEVEARHRLAFQVGDTCILDIPGDNRIQLERIGALMQRITEQKEFHVDSIVLTASSSPDGAFGRNGELARKRAKALRSYLCSRFPDSGADTLIRIRWVAEDWPELARLIRNDPGIGGREKILHL